MARQRVAAYLRVSTANGQQTTDNQRLAIEEACQRRNWRIVRVYEDVGVSGAKHDREGLDQLKQDCRANRFDVVIVWKFDRLARSTQHLLETLELLREHNVDFVSVTEAVDTTTAAGKMVLTFLASVAEFELSLTRERVRAGLARARANGTRLGRPRVGFDVNSALTLKQNGLSWPQLARRVGVSSATLRRTLTPLLKNLAAETA